MFKEYGLKITVNTSLKKEDALEVPSNLVTNTY